MISPEIDRRLFDTLLQSAVIDDHLREMEAMPSEDELARKYSFSVEFQAQMGRLLRKDRRAALFRSWSRFLKKMAAAAAIILALIAGSTMLIPEVRAAAFNVIVEWLDTHTGFNFTEDAPAPTSWRPSYLPAGFHEDSVAKAGEITNVVYKDTEENVIYFIYAPAREGYSFDIDNEHSDYSQISINGHPAHLFRARTPQDCSYVIWQQDLISFRLMSTLDCRELLKMAESINGSK